MSIDSIDYEYEKKKLEDTYTWLEEEIKIINKKDDELKDKIAVLRKGAKGKYDEELETHEKLYNVIHKNFTKYNEAREQIYFARIDFREYRKDKESFYIGKFGLGDSASGDEIVIDWRAPIADLYYSGVYGEAYYEAPVGVINGQLSLKRKFLIKDKKLSDAFDEGINEIIIGGAAGESGGKALVDEFLRINLEESVSSKLKEVVATIQKEQNDVIRADKNGALIVQGSAGSGKTTIALHRLAYLIYKYKNSLTGDDILVIAPNKLFLDYISEVLPNLGVDKVKQKTFEEIALEVLKLKGKVYTKDKKLSDVLENEDSESVKYITNASKVKGSLVYKNIIDRYVKYLEIHDLDIGDIKVDNYILFDTKEIKRLYSSDLSRFSLNKRKDEIKRYFGLKFNEKVKAILEKVDFLYEYNIARVKKTMEDGIERRKKLIEIYEERDNRKQEVKTLAKKNFEEYFKAWKRIDVDNLYIELFEKEEVLKEVSCDKIPEKLLQYIIQELKTNNEKGIIDSDDLAAMLYLKFRIEGVPESFQYKHIVVDEAQDYSMFQMYVMKELTLQKSITIVGDIGQGIYYYKGIDDWKKVMESVFDGNGTYVPLTQSYRSTVEIIEFANKVLEKQKIDLKPAIPVLRHGEAPEVIEYEDGKEFCAKLDAIVEKVEAMGKSSIAIIGRTQAECKKIKEVLKKYSDSQWDVIKDTDKNLKLKRIIIPSYMTKGLEFDCSIIYNCNDENYRDEDLDKKILYVALTRALHLQYVFYCGNKSPLIE